MALPINVGELIENRVVESTRIEYKSDWDPEPIPCGADRLVFKELESFSAIHWQLPPGMRFFSMHVV